MVRHLRDSPARRFVLRMRFLREGVRDQQPRRHQAVHGRFHRSRPRPVPRGFRHGFPSERKGFVSEQGPWGGSHGRDSRPRSRSRSAEVRPEAGPFRLGAEAVRSGAVLPRGHEERGLFREHGGASQREDGPWSQRVRRQGGVPGGEPSDTEEGAEGRPRSRSRRFRRYEISREGGQDPRPEPDLRYAGIPRCRLGRVRGMQQGACEAHRPSRSPRDQDVPG